MSKANQKFVQADEAVSPVIGVILMVAITVVLAAVVFVLVSNLSKTSDKAEDAAFKADSPVKGQIHVTMIKMGTNGPYSIDTADALTADDVSINLDGALCDANVNDDTAEDNQAEFKSLTGLTAQAGATSHALHLGTDVPALGVTDAGAQWGAGETIIFSADCGGDAVTAAGAGLQTCAVADEGDDTDDCLASSTEHRIQVTVRGTLIFEGNVVIR